MQPEKQETLHYKRSHFATQLPIGYLYSPSHFWLAEIEPGRWRVGMTRFAARMLGEMVDHGFEFGPGDPVEPGQVIGWVEGFKAISDLYCVGKGQFAGSNPALKDEIELINQDCYGRGWLYQIAGDPDPKCVDVHAYRDLLDRTIERMLEKEKHDE